MSVTGPVSVIVELTDGTRVRKHFDNIRKYEAEIVESPGDEQSFELETESCTDAGDYVESPTLPDEVSELEDDAGSGWREPEPSCDLSAPSNRKTYPSRNRKPPDYLRLLKGGGM